MSIVWDFSVTRWQHVTEVEVSQCLLLGGGRGRARWFGAALGLRRLSYAWDNWYAPSSLFMFSSVLRIVMDSRICLSSRFDSLHTTLALSQSGTWLRLFMWSVMADWWTSVVLRRVALVRTFLWSCVSTFLWCSLSRVPNFLPDSPIYKLGQFLQPILYTLPHTSSCMILSLGWTKIFRRVL